MKWEELDFILKNEKYYRQFVTMYHQEQGISDDLGVQNNSFGNTNEKKMIKMLEDPEYKKATKIVNAIDDFLENYSEIYIFIFRYKYRQGLSIPQIARKINYSESTVKKRIKRIRIHFKKCL